jgi:mannose-1-phosphate guanylyltransferase
VKAVILAGGMGSRLRPYTYVVPKAMLPVGDKPILERIIEFLKRNRIKELVVATAFHGKQIEDYFGDGSEFNVVIEYARSKKPLGTAGQLKTAEPFVSETFVAMNGDILIDVDIRRLVAFHRRMRAIGTIALRHYDLPIKYGIITLGKSERILEWKEKPELQLTMNIGFYVFEPRIFSKIKAGRTVSLERETFPNLIKGGQRLYGYVSDTEYYDVADIEDLEKLDKLFQTKRES